AEDGIRDKLVTGVQTCALPISPLAQAEVEVDERLQPERVQHERVAGLGRAVRGDQRAGGGRSEACGDECGGSGDEAVEQDGNALGRTAEGEASEDCDLEAAESGQHGERSAL